MQPNDAYEAFFGVASRSSKPRRHSPSESGRCFSRAFPNGEVSIEVTAHRLGLSSRTRQRRLKPEGTSYKEVVRKTREQIARDYLTNTTLTYAEISFLVGFEEPSSFFRALREWTGEKLFPAS